MSRASTTPGPIVASVPARSLDAGLHRSALLQRAIGRPEKPCDWCIQPKSPMRPGGCMSASRHDGCKQDNCSVNCPCGRRSAAAPIVSRSRLALDGRGRKRARREWQDCAEVGQGGAAGCPPNEARWSVPHCSLNSRPLQSRAAGGASQSHQGGSNSPRNLTPSDNGPLAQTQKHPLAETWPATQRVLLR
jgi:hypothetical protein